MTRVSPGPPIVVGERERAALGELSEGDDLRAFVRWALAEIEG